MAERAPNLRVRDILLDMARTWTRLALEAEQWTEANRPPLRLKKGLSKKKPRPSVTSPIPFPPLSSPRGHSVAPAVKREAEKDWGR
jgi:hypothetical protein